MVVFIVSRITLRAFVISRPLTNIWICIEDLFQRTDSSIISLRHKQNQNTLIYLPLMYERRVFASFEQSLKCVFIAVILSYLCSKAEGLKN